jgi:hypothetical protein
LGNVDRYGETGEDFGKSRDLANETDQQIDLATALGEEVPTTDAPKVKRSGR